LRAIATVPKSRDGAPLRDVSLIQAIEILNVFDTSPTLARALAAQNYDEPTPVQAAVLAPDASGRDMVVSAQTGSGKTVAYGLAMGPDILGETGVIAASDAPSALIIAPTRELALQVERELVWLYQYSGARIVSCVGGMDPGRERRKLYAGADIIVGTPGRLRDHMERGALNVSAMRAVILDEADEMLDLGFREDIEFILGTTPAERRTLLFSATIPRAIAALAQRYQRNALRIEVAGKERGHADIEYRAIRVAHKEHELAVVNLLRFFEAQTAIVFCNTREAVRHMHATLQERGFSSVLLSGELSQQQRNQSMQALRDGRARVCIATDVAARGIDVPNLSLVIHAELPNDAETLQHRSGRTGRAGKKGVSAMIVPLARQRKAHLLLRDANLKAVWSGPPTIEEIRKLDRERMMQDPALQTPPDEEDLVMARELLAERTAEEVCASLLHFYRARLPAIEEVSDPGDIATGREARAPREYAPSDRAAPARRERSERSGEDGPARPHKGHGIPGGVWFRLDIGRTKNADPKWLMPMLCRKGEISRQEVGAIRIFDNETKVEIAASVADQFAINIRKPGGENIRVERLEEFERRRGSNDAPAGEAPAQAERAPRKPAGEARDYSAKREFKKDFKKDFKGDKPYERKDGPKFAGKRRDDAGPKHARPAPPPPKRSERDATRYDWKAHKPKSPGSKAQEAGDVALLADVAGKTSDKPAGAPKAKDAAAKPFDKKSKFAGGKDFKPGFKPDFKKDGARGGDRPLRKGGSATHRKGQDRGTS
jgi:ATP-dependent RNA helicase DeaD